MKTIFIKVTLLTVVFAASFSCSEKRGLDKIKEGVKEVSEDVSDEAEDIKEDNKNKQIRVKFGK